MCHKGQQYTCKPSCALNLWGQATEHGQSLSQRLGSDLMPATLHLDLD